MIFPMMFCGWTLNILMERSEYKKKMHEKMHSLLCVVSFEQQPSMNNSHPDIHISGNYQKEKKTNKK